MMKSVRLFVILLLLAPVILFGQVARVNTTLPRRGPTATTIAWNAGTVANGGRIVAYAASTSTAVTVSKANCAAPALSACNIFYVNSAGVAAVTIDRETALASGSSIIALIETDGSRITNIIPWSLVTDTSPALAGALVYDCGVTVACALTSKGAAVIYTIGTPILTLGAASLTGLPFTDAGSFGCTGSYALTTPGTGFSFLNLSGATATLTASGSTSSTDRVHVVCVGW